MFKNHQYSEKYKNIKFYNFWQMSVEDNWLFQFITQRRIASHKDNIAFFSVFGPRIFIKGYKGKKIFFTGENVQPSTVIPQRMQYSDNCVNEVDLSLGFDYLDNHNYLRFPLWIMYMIPPNATLSKIKTLIENINNQSFRLSPNRNRFACQISRHDVNGIRGRVVCLLNNIDHVTCAGNFMNNSSELHIDYNDNKIEFLKNFKFNICAENSSERGYITEKIFESILGGCIPVYWGGLRKEFIEPEIINENSFLYYEIGRERELTDMIELLHMDDKTYQHFISIPPFKKEAPELIWERIQKLEKLLKELFY